MSRTKEEAAWAMLFTFRTQMCRENTTMADHERSQMVARLRYVVSEWEKAMINHIEDGRPSIA
jgi:hypothetical protein